MLKGQHITGNIRINIELLGMDIKFKGPIKDCGHVSWYNNLKRVYKKTGNYPYVNPNILNDVCDILGLHVDKYIIGNII